MNHLSPTLVQLTMNFNFKKGLAGVLVAFSFLPVFAFAEGPTATTPQGIKTEGGFCARISKVSTKVADDITRAESKQAKNKDDRATKLAEKESNADAKRAQGRSDADGKRLENWSKMARKAKTDVQKAAVETYKVAIKSAVDSRRASVDAAVKAYRDGLASAMTAHSSAISTAMLAFTTSVNTALTKAKTDCTAGIASKTVNEAFNKAVKDARKILQGARKTAEMTSGLKTLKETRDNTIKAAESVFKTATEKARADLMLALKK